MEKRFSTVTEQVTQAIREGLQESRWVKTLPGRNRLAAELGVNHKTVQSALNTLESEGLVKSQGPGRDRLIIGPGHTKPTGIRVVALPYERSDLEASDLQEIIYRLNLSGHVATASGKTLVDLGMKVEHVARFVARTEADAWVIRSAPRDILQWFVDQEIPAFSLYGRPRNVEIASAILNKAKALEELLERLHEWGHRRIVMLSREERRNPAPGAFEQSFLDKLESLGITTSGYHLPEWRNDPNGLRDGLVGLFRHTAPTALIIDDPIYYLAVVQQLASMGIEMPEQVSLACNHYSSHFDWCRPEVTHITWDSGVAVRRVISWANQVSQGKLLRRQIVLPAKLVMGGSTGPAPV